MSNNAVDEILSGIDLRALAAQLDTDPEEIRQVAETAIPTLLGSMQANAADPQGRESLLGALRHHTGEIHDVDLVDTDDGRRILGHVFADDPQRIQPLAGQNGGLLARLLPILAPIVMSWLARKVLGGGGQQSSGGLGDLLGGMLGGGAAGQQTDGGLGDLLGGMLGGGAAGQQTGGGLGDILGQVLGGALGGGPAAPAQPSGYPGFPGGGTTTPGQWPVPGGPGAAQGGQSSGDALGDLLGQILGRR